MSSQKSCIGPLCQGGGRVFGLLDGLLSGSLVDCALLCGWVIGFCWMVGRLVSCVVGWCLGRFVELLGG